MNPYAPSDTGGVWRLRIGDVAPALDELAGAVRRERSKEQLADPTLANGLAGAALCLAYCGVGESAREWSASAVEALQVAAHSWREMAAPFGLWTGMGGLGWSCSVVGRVLGEQRVEQYGAVIAERTYEMLRRGGDWSRRWDLLSGLAGVGVLFMAQRDIDLRDQGLAALARALDDARESYNGRVGWYTDSTVASFPAPRGRIGPYVNLGTAHGIPSVLALSERVIRMASTGVAQGTWEHLSSLAYEALISCIRRTDATWTCPAACDSGAPLATQAPWWCYGDAPIAMSLLLRGERRREAEVTAGAWQMLRSSSRPPVEARLLGHRDLSICHGVASQIVFATRSGEQERAEEWRETVCQALDVTGGRPMFDFRGRLQYAPGLLRGAAGVLLAVVDPSEVVKGCAWDAPLLTDFGSYVGWSACGRLEEV